MGVSGRPVRLAPRGVWAVFIDRDVCRAGGCGLAVHVYEGSGAGQDSRERGRGGPVALARSLREMILTGQRDRVGPLAWPCSRSVAVSLVYRRGRWAQQDSNLRPSGYEPAALPLSYGPGTAEDGGLCTPILQVGVTRFELVTSWSQTTRANQAAPHPAQVYSKKAPPALSTSPFGRMRADTFASSACPLD